MFVRCTATHVLTPSLNGLAEVRCFTAYGHDGKHYVPMAGGSIMWDANGKCDDNGCTDK